MSSFKTIKQQNSEKFIEKLFDGLDDPCLKAVFRVMYGLDDETVLDQLRIVNEQNLKDIESALTITDVGEPTVSPQPPSLPLSNEEGVRGNVVPPKEPEKK
jgi:hypothetical protein